MEQILARVGSLTVTEAEVEEFLSGLGQKGQSYNNPEGRRVILEQLIGNKLLLLDAKRNLLEAEPEFKAELARLKDNLLISFAANKALATVAVSDKEAEEYYNANEAQFLTPETVNASHILVATEDEANTLLAKIKSKEITFEAAAEQFSTCPSGKNGGSLGDFGKGQMVPEFDSAVFSMQVGEVTDTPVKTQFGYHLIKLNSKNEPSKMPFEQVKAQLKDMLLGQKKRKAYESKVNQLKIMYPVDILQ